MKDSFLKEGGVLLGPGFSSTSPASNRVVSNRAVST